MSHRTSTMSPSAGRASLTGAARPLLQRACACGIHTMNAECGSCAGSARELRRQAVSNSEQLARPPSIDDVLRSPGDPLDAATRAFFATRLPRPRVHVSASATVASRLEMTGPDDASEREAERAGDSVHDAAAPEPDQRASDRLSRVRIHADARAAESARSVDALAYTVGHHVVFGAGQYAPGTVAGRRLLAHELTHVLQQANDAAPAPVSGSAMPMQRKVVLRGAEMSRHDREAFVRAHHWTNRREASAVMEDMAVPADPFDFADEAELQSEIVKRLSTVRHMEESQRTIETIPGEHRSAFGYPYGHDTGPYGPRVNFAARQYWEPTVADGYARRTDAAKNRDLRARSRDQRCAVYDDPCGSYEWHLSPAGKLDPYRAVSTLFVPQEPHKRTLIHCDYLISAVQLMSLADAIGPDAFARRIKAFGADRFVLRWNAFADLHLGTVAGRGLASTQEARPSSEADLVIGDHVVFFNHLAYDLINTAGHPWRLENAVVIRKAGRRTVFLGHGSGERNAEQMRRRLAEEFNTVARDARRLVAATESANETVRAGARRELAQRNIVQVGPQWRIRGVPKLLIDLRCPRTVDVPLRDDLSEHDVLGLRHPCEPARLYKVERPIESAPGPAPDAAERRGAAPPSVPSPTRPSAPPSPSGRTDAASSPIRRGEPHGPSVLSTRAPTQVTAARTKEYRLDRVADAIDQLEEAKRLATSDPPDFATAAALLRAVEGWLGTIVTSDNIAKHFQNVGIHYTVADALTRQALGSVTGLRWQVAVLRHGGASRPMSPGLWNRTLQTVRAAQEKLAILAPTPGANPPESEAQASQGGGGRTVTAAAASVSWIDGRSPIGSKWYGIRDDEPPREASEAFVIGAGGFRFSNYLHAWLTSRDHRHVDRHAVFPNSGTYRGPSKAGFHSYQYPTQLSVTPISQGAVEGVEYTQLVGARTVSPGGIGGLVGSVGGPLGVAAGTAVGNRFGGFPPIWTRLTLRLQADGVRHCAITEHSLFPSVHFYCDGQFRSRYDALQPQQEAWQQRGWHAGNPWGDEPHIVTP